MKNYKIIKRNTIFVSIIKIVAFIFISASQTALCHRQSVNNYKLFRQRGYIISLLFNFGQLPKCHNISSGKCLRNHPALT